MSVELEDERALLYCVCQFGSFYKCIELRHTKTASSISGMLILATFAAEMPFSGTPSEETYVRRKTEAMIMRSVIDLSIVDPVGVVLLSTEWKFWLLKWSRD